MDKLTELKQKYNGLVRRYRKASDYYFKIRDPAKDKHWDEFCKLIEQMDEMIIELKNHGYEIKDNQILEGIELEG